MENLKNPSVMGKKIFKLLEREKILLLQDKEFPSIVTGIIGKQVHGSWWGHPMANPIYNGLMWLEHNRPILIVKLISGKVTYLHESLFSDIYSIVSKPRDWQLKNLKEDELTLLEYIVKREKITSDDPQLIKLFKDYKKAITTLEKRLLLYSSEEHTDSGKHIKEFGIWKNSKISISSPGDYIESQNNIEAIVANLCKKSGAKIKLPWR